ncbi:MHJ_0274 family protein [Mycoplasmopsis alligatoris]|uniref:Uncharacterized protein n=1 Tax=Mycoplasmopsis alligatoris A21JP2 TaxID=747682 RepID=D4XVX6_9BACT|nr:hypothetical protein [Mycoplasmopsis alligatoris]EFF41509.1 hypothetical protein MALL_0829 [Mycoplasmopsis alligatoris A21JP2]
MDGMVMWIIFGVIIAALVIFFAYAAIKDSIKNKKIKKEKAEFELEAKNFYKKAIIKTNVIIEKNQKLLSEFQVSIGKYKMSELTDTTRDILSEQIKEKDFKMFLIKNPEYATFVQNYVNLMDTKSNNWLKNNKNELSYFEQLKTDLDQEFFNQAQNELSFEIEEKYEKQLLKNSKSS